MSRRGEAAGPAALLIGVLSLAGCALIIGVDDPAYEPDAGMGGASGGAGAGAAGSAGEVGDGAAGQAGGGAAGSAGTGTEAGDAPACEAGQTLCGQECVDLNSNGTHCGDCDHGCGSTASQCVSGVCQPYAYYTITTSGHPTRLAIDDAWVYWITDKGGLGRVRHDDTNAPEMIVMEVDSLVDHLAVGGGYVAWGQQGADAGGSWTLRWRKTTSGSTTTDGPSGIHPTGVAIAGTTAWWADTDQRIHSVDLNSGAEGPFINAGNPKDLFAQGTTFCFIDSGSVTCADGNASPWTVASGQGDANSIGFSNAAGPENVFWLTPGAQTGELRKVLSANQQNELFSTVASSLPAPHSLYVHNDFAMLGTQGDPNGLWVLRWTATPPDVFKYTTTAAVVDIVADEAIYYVQQGDKVLYKFVL